jgi:hypothetical protein
VHEDQSLIPYSDNREVRIPVSRYLEALPRKVQEKIIENIAKARIEREVLRNQGSCVIDDAGMLTSHVIGSMDEVLTVARQLVELERDSTYQGKFKQFVDALLTDLGTSYRDILRTHIAHLRSLSMQSPIPREDPKPGLFDWLN